MSSLQDMYGRRVRVKRVRVNVPGLLPEGTVATKMVLVDEETGQELVDAFDMISHLLLPQDDGTYLISRLVEADRPEIEAPEQKNDEGK
jgi:hypothetical protein